MHSSVGIRCALAPPSTKRRLTSSGRRGLGEVTCLSGDPRPRVIHASIYINVSQDIVTILLFLPFLPDLVLNYY